MSADGSSPRGPWRGMAAHVNDVVLLLIVILLFPIAILLLGAPLALLLRFVSSVAERLW